MASDTGLPAGSADLVVGEAMLTMQGEKGKAAIVSEANRILATGGRYAIHELLLTPNNVDQTVADNLRKALATTIKVNARPLTATEWSELLESNGFKVLSIKVAPMGLLQPKQMIEDEGPRVLKIMFNLARNPQARKRVLAMRKVFSENAQNLGAISIIAEKVSDVKPAETATSETPESEASPKVTEPKAAEPKADESKTTESKPQDSKPAVDDPNANDSKADTLSKPAAPNEAAAPSKTAADKAAEPSKAETSKATAPKATAHKAASTTAETEAAAPKVEDPKKAEATPANSAQAEADTSKKSEDKKPEAAKDTTPKKAVPKPHDPRTRNKKS